MVCSKRLSHGSGGRLLPLFSIAKAPDGATEVYFSIAPSGAVSDVLMANRRLSPPAKVYRPYRD